LDDLLEEKISVRSRKRNVSVTMCTLSLTLKI